MKRDVVCGERPSTAEKQVLTLIVVAVCVLPAPAVAVTCARFGDVVTLTGRYVLHVVAPTAAGFQGRVSEDSRTANVLYLASPLCVDSDDVSEGVPAATNVQVLCPDLAAANPIAITGRLIGAHTGNGQTPVLLVCPSKRASAP